MPRLRTLTLMEEQKRELEERLKHDPRPQARERCAAILKIASGQTCHAVAKHGLLQPRDPDSVYAWLNLYEAEGIEGMLRRIHGGDRRSGRWVRPDRRTD